MHSGVQISRAHHEMVMPVYAGIQAVGIAVSEP